MMIAVVKQCRPVIIIDGEPLNLLVCIFAGCQLYMVMIQYGCSITNVQLCVLQYQNGERYVLE